MRFHYYNKTKKYLEQEPLARKIENRAIAVWNLLKIHQNPNLEVMDKKAFIKYWTQLQGFDRAIRKIQQECPHLTDKANEEKKEILEQEHILEVMGW